ncbi:MAG TPA: D-alanine--D-alanine ligase [Oculatellaceae cyanobacterium]|jgi:D-alanine-D-alanine ligase
MSPQTKLQLTPDTRIGVLYGGLSSEREVSLISGKNCFEALQRLGYRNAVLIDVGHDIAQKLAAEKVEVAYIALHGKYGEDGCIQGLLELMSIPYTGCRVAASALTMNKALTKSVLKDAGLPVIDSVVLKSGSVNGKPLNIDLPYPVMVKPITEGSSIGMSKVDKPEDLKEALQTAFQYTDEVMVEAYVKGKSLTVGVVEVDGEPKVTPILELRPTKSEWYDLEAKYTEGGTEFILPAELPGDMTKAIQEATLEAYIAAGCRGVSRVDFVTGPDNKFYILEINTIPGMTPLSDLPAQAKAMGISYEQLVECILKTAVH